MYNNVWELVGTPITSSLKKCRLSVLQTIRLGHEHVRDSFHCAGQCEGKSG